MMKYCFLIFLFLMISFSVFARPEIDSLFHALDEVIERKHEFEKDKKDEIENLSNQLRTVKTGSMEERFSVTEQLHQAYFTFNYDSALLYSRQLLEIANRSGQKDMIARAQLRMNETLLASGLFAVVKDSLEKISLPDLSDSLRAKYHYMNARLYIDMSNYYQRPFYSEKFGQLVTAHLDSAVYWARKESRIWYSLRGLRFIWRLEYQEAKKFFMICSPILKWEAGNMLLMLLLLLSFFDSWGNRKRSWSGC
ncbi:hypothetical protein [Marinilabilia salmonicolor]|uniref:hypothetical protein n=1 Tax=Marinilabilia salmonicolor TaxID=989 RepID=UPI0011E012EE|nr:hypothetical protein [Marinilabilia salmonicolor]